MRLLQSELDNSSGYLCPGFWCAHKKQEPEEETGGKVAFKNRLLKPHVSVTCTLECILAPNKPCALCLPFLTACYKRITSRLVWRGEMITATNRVVKCFFPFCFPFQFSFLTTSFMLLNMETQDSPGGCSGMATSFVSTFCASFWHSGWV